VPIRQIAFRMRPRLVLAATFALAAAGPVFAAATPDWRTLAACAAAYRANAKVADPDRPASMTAQVSEVADDYEKAAAEAYRRAAGVRPAEARGKAAAYAARRAITFARQPRRRVEAFIDACPQVASSP